ncbi:hypothetical protein Leryth_008562 [Lithospermum erythrorhizon]|nr:hypothetical protein Leryth_008562 [Lithospermum erythrorhizon]
MAWQMVAVSLAVLWVASLYKILFRPLSSSIRFSNDGRVRNILLVIAHPDDESMFFTPTIIYLTSRGHNVHILCISTGNADGMGNIRREELYLASTILKVTLNLAYREFCLCIYGIVIFNSCMSILPGGIFAYILNHELVSSFQISRNI